MDDILKAAILNLSKSSDWAIIKPYIIEQAKSLLTEVSNTSLPAEEFKLDRLAKERAYHLLVSIFDNLQMREPRTNTNANMR